MAPQALALSPFKHRTFTVMWLAALVSNIGTWMHAVGAGWLMTDLSPSPLVVALVQTATTLPVFLFALMAGALADIFNRRTLLLTTHITLLVCALVFAMMVWFDAINTVSLLLFTFLLGTGAAFIAPAWQATIPQLVPKDDLPQAVALGGISINLSRAIGPALAGILISLYGLPAPFIANALSFSLIILVLASWTYQAPAASQTLPPERIGSAMKTGLRYAQHSPPLKATLWHIAGFMFFANAFWGLLPVIARNQLNADAWLFGLIMGAIGVGAVTGGLFLPRLKKRLSANQLVAVGTTGVALISAYFAIATQPLLALLASLIFGMSWIGVMASVNVSAHVALPDWIRARGLAIYIMVFYGSMSLGATFWGWLAEVSSVPTSLLSAAVGSLLFIAFSYRTELQQGQRLNLSAANHWPEPDTHTAIPPEQGPVVIQVHYTIAEPDRTAFLTAIYQLKAERLRHGAKRWGVYESTRTPGHFIEHFLEDSWAQHLRHHQRVTYTDKALQDTVIAFHQGTTPPQAEHFLAVRP